MCIDCSKKFSQVVEAARRLADLALLWKREDVAAQIADLERKIEDADWCWVTWKYEKAKCEKVEPKKSFKDFVGWDPAKIKALQAKGDYWGIKHEARKIGDRATEVLYGDFCLLDSLMKLVKEGKFEEAKREVEEILS
jgi:hypothetical protein